MGDEDIDLADEDGLDEDMEAPPDDAEAWSASELELFNELAKTGTAETAESPEIFGRRPARAHSLVRADV